MRTTRIRFLRPGGLLAVVLATLQCIGQAGATSSNTDVSDIWYNPSESGWGMQMVNTGTFVFATLYVYGTDRKPTWFTGQLTRTGASQVTYSGPLYANTGPYFGGPFNPNNVDGRQVGSMTFVLTAVSNGELSYTVDGVPVNNKPVQRQPLTLDNYTGSYNAILSQTVTGCTNPANNGTSTINGTVNIAQNGTSILLTTSFGSGSCTNNGTYSQLGRMGTVQGTYSCTWGEMGTVTLFEMNIVPYMFTSRMETHSPNFGCNADAEIVGLYPR